MVEESREARERLEREEAERRAANEREQINSLDHEMETPRHISSEHFSEVSPATAEAQKQGGILEKLREFEIPVNPYFVRTYTAPDTP